MADAAIQAFAQMEASQKTNPKGGASPQKDSLSGMMDSKSVKEKGFLEMNAVVARMLCHLTASSRFHGEMNVDMNEICTNLVPFPRMKFLMTALSPQRVVARTASHNARLLGKATIQRGFSDILGPSGQLTSAHLYYRIIFGLFKYCTTDFSGTICLKRILSVYFCCPGYYHRDRYPS